MATNIKKASKLSNGALTAFRDAHDSLSEADRLYALEEDQRREAARSERELAEQRAQEHENHAEAARLAREANSKPLQKLKEFLD